MAQISNGKTRFLDLANETIEYILYAPDLDHSDLCCFATVCKRFRVIASADELWKWKAKQRWRNWKHPPPPCSAWKTIFKKKYQVECFLYKFITQLSKECYNKADIPNKCFAKFASELDKLDDVSFQAAEDILYNVVSTKEHDNLTLRFYSEKVNRYVIHHKLKKSFTKLFSLPEDQQWLEKGAIYIAQWCNTNETIVENEILAELDAIAASVQAAMDEEEDGQGDVLNPGSNVERVIATLNRIFFDKLGFHGNTDRYYDLSNSFINKIMEKRTGIPISLSIIYLAVARRLGLCLDPVNFPSHFILKIPDLGRSCSLSNQFIDVFNKGKILTQDQCVDMLHFQTTPERLFPRASPKDVYRRMLTNIIHIHKSTTSIDVSSLNELRMAIELMLLLNPNDDEQQLMLSRIYLHYNINLDEVVEKLRHLTSPRTNPHVGLLDSLLEHARHQQSMDEEDFSSKLRSDPENANVLYRVGMIMRHRRYHYYCVIYGWDYFCDMNESWKVQMGVYNLSHGATQPFYNVLAHDGSCRYASQENLEPIKEARPVPHPEVGRHFSAFSGYCYIPNEYLRMKYPEDHPIPPDCCPLTKCPETEREANNPAAC